MVNGLRWPLKYPGPFAPLLFQTSSKSFVAGRRSTEAGEIGEAMVLGSILLHVSSLIV